MTWSWHSLKLDHIPSQHSHIHAIHVLPLKKVNAGHQIFKKEKHHSNQIIATELKMIKVNISTGPKLQTCCFTGFITIPETIA